MQKSTPVRRPVMAAMVLGATLAALAPSQAQARVASEPAPGVVADLGRYCSACWRNAGVPVDLRADCTQDVFQRLLERVPQASWQSILAGETEERRLFLRAIDTVKKRVRRTRHLSGAVAGVADHRAAGERRLAEDREAVRTASARLLGPRQQRILQHCFEGWSVHEIASELSLPAARVSDEKYKAVQRVRGAFNS